MVTLLLGALGRAVVQWRNQEFGSTGWGRGGGLKNAVEDRENGDLGAVAP
jgi:hypothetical protein